MAAEDQPRLDCEGLKEDWDGLGNIREAPYTGWEGPGDWDSCGSMCGRAASLDVLMPLAARSFAHAHRRPEIDGLREKVSLILQANQRQPDESTEDDWAWELRKQLTFMTCHEAESCEEGSQY